MLVLSVAASTTPQTPTESKTIFNHDGIHGNACTGHRLVAVFVRDHRKASKVYPYSMDMSSSLLLNIDPGLPMDCDPSFTLIHYVENRMRGAGPRAKPVEFANMGHAPALMDPTLLTDGSAHMPLPNGTSIPQTQWPWIGSMDLWRSCED